MSELILYINNAQNSVENNTPGYHIWLGGQEEFQGDIILNTDTNKQYIFSSQLLTNGKLDCWYLKENIRHKFTSIDGPFSNNMTINIPKVTL